MVLLSLVPEPLSLVEQPARADRPAPAPAAPAALIRSRRARVGLFMTLLGTGQKGDGAIWSRTVTQRMSVNASTLARTPPNRVPLPDARTPPNGTCASSFTVWSLMCAM